VVVGTADGLGVGVGVAVGVAVRAAVAVPLGDGVNALPAGTQAVRSRTNANGASVFIA